MDSQSIRNMLKIELHTHIEGTLTDELAQRFSDRNGLNIPRANAHTGTKFAFSDLTSFLSVYYANMQSLITQVDFEELAFAHMQQCWKDNVIHCDLFFDPQAHTSRGIAFSTVVEGLDAGIQKGREKLGVSVSLIMCFLRDMDVASAAETLDQAAAYRHIIVGVGLDSDERGNPPNKFAAVFKKARAQGFKLTCHCDIDQQNSIEHIRQAIDDIGVDRIDHGSNVVEDDSLIQKLIDKRIGLTCCPISNSIVTRDFKGQEILSLLRRGVRVTLNSDDPSYFQADLSDNLIKMAMETDVRRLELIKMQRNALDMAWVSDSQRAKLRAAFDQWVISVELCG